MDRRPWRRREPGASGLGQRRGNALAPPARGRRVCVSVLAPPPFTPPFTPTSPDTPPEGTLPSSVPVPLMPTVALLGFAIVPGRLSGDHVAQRAWLPPPSTRESLGAWPRLGIRALPALPGTPEMLLPMTLPGVAGTLCADAGVQAAPVPLMVAEPLAPRPVLTWAQARLLADAASAPRNEER